tara:strand:+ start:2205 stop:3101 length:897 start_codon:yes stop_codon:yes gene_type:complete
VGVERLVVAVGSGGFKLIAVSAVLCMIAACSDVSDDTNAVNAGSSTRLIQLWSAGTPAFGVFVPNERPRGEVAPDGSRLPPLYTTEGGASLGKNPLLDYLFLNLEGNYDTEAVAAIAEGIGQSDKAEGPSLLVRIPPIERDGAEAARARVIESLQLGADGIVIPHVRSAEEARLAVSFFTDAGVSVWSPDNPDGEKLAMIMIEDAGALAAAAEIADTPGYSVLACGIGSLSRDLGSREAGESGTQEVLQQSARVGLPNMITANAQDVEQRLEEGFLGLLMSGPSAGEAIRIGRLAVGR